MERKDKGKGKTPRVWRNAPRKTLKEEGFRPDPDVEAGHDPGDRRVRDGEKPESS